jgi:hypothetical protein
MTGRILFLLLLGILSLAAFALTSGVKIYEQQINESEFKYADGSAKSRLKLLKHRPARMIQIPDE